jgi:hypothetical protein
MLTLMLIWVVCALACAMIAPTRGRNPFAWLVIGFVFGLLGVAALLLMEDLSKPRASIPPNVTPAPGRPVEWQLSARPTGWRVKSPKAPKPRAEFVDHRPGRLSRHSQARPQSCIVAAPAGHP